MRRRRSANRKRRRRESRWHGRKGQPTGMPWWLLGLLALVALAFGLARALR